MRTWTVDDPVFRSSFLIRLGGTRQGAFDHYCRKLGLDPAGEGGGDLDRSGALATVFFRPGHKNFILWFREMPGSPTAAAIGMVAHEALHAAVHIIRNSGIESLTDDSEEAFAYYAEFVARETSRRLWPGAK